MFHLSHSVLNLTLKVSLKFVLQIQMSHCSVPLTYTPQVL